MSYSTAVARSSVSRRARTSRPAAVCHQPQTALYNRGMGARDRNFYNDYLKRTGYEAVAAKIEDAYLDGDRDEAIAAVPDAS
jgi:hypothetical protein